jgi:16S rRNA (guanine966-N2)-methyltransferase
MIRADSRASLVRILAGKWKGRRLDVPVGARPTSGRARAALFDLLGPDRIAGARVLDLFAGSGAVGLEAVSRGAVRAVLVEADPRALERTLERLGDPEVQVRIAPGPAASAIAALAREAERFDVVFADPPYGRGAEGELDRIAALLDPAGVLVVQADADSTPGAPQGMRALRSRAYGRNVFHFFEIL